MNDENQYQPYQYGSPQEPENETPDLNDKEETVIQEESQYTPRYDYSYSQQMTTPQEPKKGKKVGIFGKVVVTVFLALVFGVLASVVFQASNWFIGNFYGTTSNNNVSGQPVGTTQISSNSGTTVISDVADVTESVMPSVVSIVSLSVQEVQNYFFGGTTQYEVPSSGSGIIIGQNDAELLIVTNNHVVEGSKTITVTFDDGNSIETQIKGTDSDLDLAILSVPLNSIEKSTKDKIKTATLGDSDALRVGESAIAIGNALGYGQSVTAGIISALNCSLDNYEGQLIQTDAAINPGNSGGALLNANGEVIGINTAKVSDESVEGMGYAIPISDVLDVLNELMTKETRTKVPESQRGVIGIEGITVSADMIEYYKVPKGVYVRAVYEGSAAEKAKLPVNCIITKLDGTSVNSLEKLQEELQYYKAGEKVELTIMVQSREGYKKETIDITLGKAE